MVSDKCSECGKHCGRRSGNKHGFKVCGKCKRKSSFPNIFLKTHPQIAQYEEAHKAKYKKRGRRFKKEEKIYLYWQHVKKGETSQEANASIKNIEDIVRKGHIVEKEEPSFKDDFSKLVEKKK